MSLINKLQQTLNRQVIDVAKVIGQRDGGVVVAQTMNKSTVLLKGSMETGKQVFYNRLDNKIISEAPNIIYSDFGV